MVSAATGGTPHSGAASSFSHRVMSLGSKCYAMLCMLSRGRGGGWGWMVREGREKGCGKGGVGELDGVGKEGERKEGDFVTL